MRSCACAQRRKSAYGRTRAAAAAGASDEWVGGMRAHGRHVKAHAGCARCMGVVMMTMMRKRARDAYRYGLASATDVWTRDRAVVDGLSRVAAAGWLRRGRGRGLLGILRQSLAPAGAAERASWCRGIQQRNRTARGGNSLQSIHTHTYTPRGHRYAALATKSCGALVTAAASEIQPRPFVRTGTGCPESAAAARVHGRYHVITMYNPQSPFMRLHVPIREECCEIGRV